MQKRGWWDLKGLRFGVEIASATHYAGFHFNLRFKKMVPVKQGQFGLASNLPLRKNDIFNGPTAEILMSRSCAILLLVLIILPINPVAGRSQVNRRLAVDFLKLGTNELEAGNLETALAHFERAIELDGNYGAAYFSRGLVRKRQRDLDGAISDFTRSIQLKPIAEAYLNRGATLKDKGDPDGAMVDYNKAIELKPDYADAFFNRGIARDDKGDFAGAIGDFTRAIELNPGHARAFVGRGFARMRKGDVDSALADYSKGIELNPRGFLGFYNRAFARKSKGDLDGALADLSNALEIDSNDLDARYERGIVRGAKGDLDGALADFAKVIELDPRHAKAYANRGMIMLLRRQDTEAQKELDTALRLDSSLKTVLQKSVDQIMKTRSQEKFQ